MLHCVRTLKQYFHESARAIASSQIAYYNRNFIVSLNLLCNIIVLDIQFIQPPVNLFKVTFNESSSSVQLTCSLNIDIPSSVTVIWFFNNFIITLPHEVITAGNTTILLIENPQPSDAGDYTSVFIGLNVQGIFVLG